MVEPYQWLVENAERLGYKRENVGPASVDLELGDAIYEEAYVDKVYRKDWKFESYGWNDTNLTRVSIFEERNEFFIFLPCNFYLCSTREYIKVPPTHCAFINMRSSLARKGLGHKMAGFVDPGFEGEITLELEAAVPVEVKRGERVVQIIYFRLTEETLKPYQGKYKGQRGPTLSY